MTQAIRTISLGYTLGYLSELAFSGMPVIRGWLIVAVIASSKEGLFREESERVSERRSSITGVSHKPCSGSGVEDRNPNGDWQDVPSNTHYVRCGVR